MQSVLEQGVERPLEIRTIRPEGAGRSFPCAFKFDVALGGLGVPTLQRLGGQVLDLNRGGGERSTARAGQQQQLVDRVRQAVDLADGRLEFFGGGGSG